MFKSFIRSIIGRENIAYYRHLFPSRKEQELLKNRSIFYKQFINPGDLCFDIGANFGNRISALLKIGSHVVAVEPQPICIIFLKKKFEQRIQLVEKGIGAVPGKLPLFISDAHTLSSFSTDWIDSVKESGRFVKHTWKEKIEVDIITLQDLIITYGTPRFIKIDVEGYEFEVLSGLKKPIEWICFEYTIPERLEEALKCLDLLANLNADYRCNYIRGEETYWFSEQWLTIKEMKLKLQNNNSNGFRFGDIYLNGKK